MKYATFSRSTDIAARLGAVHGDRVIDLGAAVPSAAGGPLSSVLDLVQRGPSAWREVEALVGRGNGLPSHPLADVRLHPPIPRPAKNVFCLGLNYIAHAKESAQARGREVKIPQAPVVFTKAPTSANGPFDDIRVDRTLTQQVDWEVELGVIIGVGGRDIARADALRHVFGYTIVNDVSARDLQALHVQWFKGKSLDTFCPMGPVAVTADEFGNPQDKRLQLRVNGVGKQDASTAQMIFPVDVIIESLSRGLTLEPGDIIATGTPEGVGLARTPQEFLVDGDVVEAEIEGIGIIRNRVVDIA